MKKKNILINYSHNELLNIKTNNINTNWNNSQNCFKKDTFTPILNTSIIKKNNNDNIININYTIQNNYFNIYFSNLNNDSIPNPVLYLKHKVKYTFRFKLNELNIFFISKKNLKNELLTFKTHVQLINGEYYKEIFVNFDNLLEGYYLITSNFFYKSNTLEIPNKIYHINTGNNFFVISNNYQYNYKLFTNQGFNMLIKIDSSYNKHLIVNKLIHILDKSRINELQSTYFYYKTDNDNRLQILIDLYKLEIINKISLDSLFPQLDYFLY